MNNLSCSGSVPEREYVNLVLKELKYCQCSRKGHERNAALWPPQRRSSPPYITELLNLHTGIQAVPTLGVTSSPRANIA